MSSMVPCPRRLFPLRPLLLHAAVGCALLLTACEDSLPPETVTRIQLAVVSGDDQVAPTGELLPAPLVVRVTDQANRPLPGIAVRWTLLESGGFRGGSVPAVTTDANGQASLVRRLGFLAGAYETIAAAGPDPAGSVAFTSTAHVQHAVRMQPADGAGAPASDTVLATLAPHRVLVLDHRDRPVAGVEVSWTTAGEGALSEQTSTTDASGIAQVTHTLGQRSGRQDVRAHVIGLLQSPVTFPVSAEPGNPVAFVAVAGTGQIGRVGTRVQPYAVSVTDAYGNGHRGLSVEWRVDAGDGSLDRTTSVTTTGFGTPGGDVAAAAVSHLLGPDEHPQVVTATLAGVSGFAPVSFQTLAVTQIVGVGETCGGAGAGDWDYSVTGDCDAGSRFAPAMIEVPAGKSVLWEWAGGAHDVVFEDDPSPPVSAELAKAGRHVRTFTQAGTYRYRCTQHSTSFADGEVGAVVVR